MGARRRGREAALQMLYQMEASDVRAGEAIRLFWPNLAVQEDADAEGKRDTRGAAEAVEFANALVLGCEERVAEIDERIREASQHWRLERMTRVDRNILRLGTFELLGMSDVPRRVTLNEAVELAKRYGSEGSSGFVNGILDRIASDLQKE